jgi:NADH dehydrogenase [ubiquinone] 1 alpha subcomplex assembly factor 1
VLFESSIARAAQEWVVVNDGVMGGVSSSSVTDSADGVVFSGSVSLDNNGGFASIRSVFDDVVAAGDGNTYVVELRTDESNVAYWQRFTPASATAQYTLPLDGFAPHSRFGEPIEDGPAFDPSRVGSVAVYILDKQTGDFRLVISRITAR